MVANPCTPTRNEPTAIEKASAAVIASINDAISWHFIHFKVSQQVDEATFRSIIAGYFERKSLEDWCKDLGIDPEEGAP